MDGIDSLLSLCFCGEGLNITDPETGESGGVIASECFFNGMNLLAAGCTFDNELMFNLGKGLSEKAYNTGADIKGMINTGIIREPMKEGAERMISEDAHVVYSLVKSYIEGAGANVGACGMLGGEEDFCERNFDNRALYELYLRPFLRLASFFDAALIPAGLMNGEPVCENKDFLALLKNNLPPYALIMNSFLSVSDPVAAVKAGAGLIAPATKSNRAELISAFEKGEITREQINGFVSNTAAFIQKLKKSAHAAKGAFRHYDEEKILSEKSIVLLENNGVLPAANSENCFVINGGVVPEFERLYGADNSTHGKTTALVFACAPDGTLEKPTIKALKEMREKGLETVLILVCPRPCALPETLDADAVIFVPKIYSGTAKALCDIIKGDAEPCGRLPVSWAHSASDYPALINPRLKDKGMFTYESVLSGYKYFSAFNTPVRYNFGHGLSYADYKISAAELSVDGDAVSIDFSIENLSGRDGETVVFAFDNYTAKQVFGLKKRLIGFTRVVLQGKGIKRVHMRIENDEFFSYSEKEKGYVFLGGKHEISLAFGAQKNVCRGEIKFKKPEPDFSFCDAKKFPSYYGVNEFLPNAVEIETLTGVKIFAPPHGRNEHVLSVDNPLSEKSAKKALKLIKKFCKTDFTCRLDKIPVRMLEKFIR